jgi:hypothetical protein
MFYFLDGVEATPLCRGCITRQERERALLGVGTLERDLAALPAPPQEGSPMSLAMAPRDLGETVRTYLEEELDRIQTSLERLPEEDPGALLARQLEIKARQELAGSRLSEAVLCMGDLRRNLADLERSLERSGAAAPAPWDESVEEMLERVNARARALTPPSRRAPIDRTTVPAADGGPREVPPTPVELA